MSIKVPSTLQKIGKSHLTNISPMYEIVTKLVDKWAMFCVQIQLPLKV